MATTTVDEPPPAGLGAVEGAAPAAPFREILLWSSVGSGSAHAAGAGSLVTASIASVVISRPETAAPCNSARPAWLEIGLVPVLAEFGSPPADYGISQSGGRIMRNIQTTVMAILSACVLVSSGLAADLSVLSAVAMKPALDDLARDFQARSGHKVTLAYATAGIVRDRIRGGEGADVGIMPRSAFDPLLAEGKIAAGSATRVAQSLIAVAVRSGTPKPDISSVEALRRSLLAAKSIVYPDPAQGGATGIHAARVIDRLGIADQVKAKTTLVPGSEYADVLAKGEAEIGIVQPMVVLTFPGVDVVGPLPTELQNTTDFVFFAGVVASSKEAETARAFIQFLLMPEAARLIKAKGMEPG